MPVPLRGEQGLRLLLDGGAVPDGDPQVGVSVLVDGAASGNATVALPCCGTAEAEAPAAAAPAADAPSTSAGADSADTTAGGLVSGADSIAEPDAGGGTDTAKDQPGLRRGPAQQPLPMHSVTAQHREALRTRPVPQHLGRGRQRTRTSISRASSAPGSSVSPLWTGPVCTTVLRGAVSHRKR